MTEFFYWIEDLFVDTLFAPFDALRALELESWFGANIMSWLFLIIGMVAAVYWCLQLKKFDDRNEEDKTVTAHSYL